MILAALPPRHRGDAVMIKDIVVNLSTREDGGGVGD
jgi:hypothetical protein